MEHIEFSGGSKEEKRYGSVIVEHSDTSCHNMISLLDFSPIVDEML